MSFNSSQLTAVEHVNGPMLVLAGPGSGKTTVITHRIKHLVEKENIDSSSILVITFTKAAAKEMEERYLQLTNGIKQRVTFGTFHAIFFKILKLAYNFNVNNIISENERYEIIKAVIYSNHFEINDEGEYIANALSEISKVKNERISINQYYSINFSEAEFKCLYDSYDKALKSKRLIDFDDMMVYVYELFVKRPDILSQWQQKYQYILIDEFQDINMIQYEIIKMLAKPQDNLFIVGDDDQSIYGFRGAKPQIMLNFPKDYKAAQQVVLNINYRSTPEIVNCSKKLISFNKNRYSKDINADKASGSEVVYKNFKSLYEQNTEIVKIIADAYKRGENLGNYAIITRTNIQPGLLIQKLMEFNLPFYSRDGIPNIFDHWIAKDIFAYINIALGSNTRANYLRIANRPNRYISRDSFTSAEIDFEDLYKYYEDKPYMLSRLDSFKDKLGMIKLLSPYSAVNFIIKSIGYSDYLREYAEYRRINYDDLLDVLNEISDSAKQFKHFDEWYEFIEEYREKIKNQAKTYDYHSSVFITTMHGSKGLEFDNVIIPDANEEICPHKKAVLDPEIEEERRMFYVAMTRARKKLYIFSCCDRYNKDLEPSRFVEELGFIKKKDSN